MVVSAQSQPETFSSIDSLRSAIRSLRSELDSLRLQNDGKLESDQSHLDDMEDRLERRIQALDVKIDAVNRSIAPIVFNPRTTAFLNFAGRLDNQRVIDAAGLSEINDRMFLRTIELDFRAPVDPYADAIVILSVEDEAGTGFAFDAEEAYGLLKRIPILESSPLGVKVKVGRFRAPLGVNNRLHMHDIPWITRPLVVSEFLGTEHGDFFESGFNPVGVNLDFFLPTPIPGTTLEANASVVRSGDIGISRDFRLRQPAYQGRLTLSGDWNSEHLLVIGGSAYRETGLQSTNLFGADLTYRWAPAEQSNRNSFVAGGELFWAQLPSVGASQQHEPFGGFGYLQYQASYFVYLGARYDYVESKIDRHFITKGLSGYISYYTTEFLRFRCGFEHRESVQLDARNLNTALFEVNFVFGSHPTEPYWVNR